MVQFVPLVPGLPGGPELLVVLLVLVLLFGANEPPKLARAGGRAMGEFTRGRDEVEADLETAAGDARRERVREDTRPVVPARGPRDARHTVVDASASGSRSPSTVDGSRRRSSSVVE